MRCHICGKEITKDLYVYRRAITCCECVMNDCYKDVNNSLYIDSYFRDVNEFNIVYQNNLHNYKKKLKSSLIMYNSTKNPLHKMDMKYYSKRISDMEELLK